MRLYESTVRAEFLSRPNRFIAMCRLEGREVRCHVKNTGRCRELLIPGCTVILAPGTAPGRKTPFDLVAVYKGDMLVNMDSQAPNRVFGEYLRKGALIECPDEVAEERRFENSRFDFFIRKGERNIFAEVKGVTLENQGICAFPDAPTDRGRKHLRELIVALEQGFEAMAVFIVQMQGMKYLVPNADTDPEFARELKRAKDAGVKIMALECGVSEDSMEVLREIPVRV